MWADHNPLGDGRPATGDRAGDMAPGSARIVYDVPHPAPWGAIPAAYLWTKSIAAGVLIVAALLLGSTSGGDATLADIVSPILALLFLGITVVLLIADLKQPWRFYYLITKPNFRSWLVWGTYILIDLRRARAGLACQRVVRRIGFRRAHRGDGGFRGRIRVLLRLSVRAGQSARSVAEPGFHLASAGAGADRRRGVVIVAAVARSAGPIIVLAAARFLAVALAVGLVMIPDELTLPADERGIPARRRSTRGRTAAFASGLA